MLSEPLSIQLCTIQTHPPWGPQRARRQTKDWDDPKQDNEAEHDGCGKDNTSNGGQTGLRGEVTFRLKPGC